jgi:radical SAM superfamily enzyme YgiQ (UPF0313 family)
MRVLVVSANREVMPQAVVPLGAISVAAAVRDAHDVDVLDLCFEQDPLGAVRRAIADAQPDLVGVGLRNLRLGTYAESDDLMTYYRGVVRAVREATRAPVVLGGAGFSLRPQTLLEDLGADYGVVGEGERAFRGLCDDLAAGRRPPRLVSAATYGGGDTLDDLPRPARDLVDPRYYDRDGTDNVQTKRGCCFDCAYCDYPDIEGRRFRLREPARVAAEAADRARAPGVSHLFFVDSVFNVPHAHALAVCRELVATGVPMKWVAYVSPVGFDDALARAMAEAGCVGVEIGADSGDDEGLARLRKPFTVADIRRAHALCAAHGIRDCHTFVLGVGDEAEADVRRTLAFVDDLDPDVAVFVVFVEDREDRAIERARHRDAILRLLADEAPKRAGWVVPELSIRFGEKVARLAARRRFRGPAWLALADRP